MDYSMLLIISFNDLSKSEIEDQIDDGRNWKDYVMKNYRISFTIIDFLQSFNKYKFLERTMNNLKYKKKAGYSSCQDPVSYGKRFLKFVNFII